MREKELHVTTRTRAFLSTRPDQTTTRKGGASLDQGRRDDDDDDDQDDQDRRPNLVDENIHRSLARPALPPAAARPRLTGRGGV